MSIPTVIFGILFFIFVKEKVVRPEDQDKMKFQDASVKTNVEKLSDKIPAQKFSFMSLMKNRNLLCAFILCFCSIYANFVIITWLPRFLQVERGFAGTSVGFISSLVPWASIPGALLLAYLSDKYKVTKKFVFALVPLALISTFGIAFVTDRTLLIAVLILYGLTGKLALDPILVAFVTKNAPKSSLSTTLSAYNFVGMSGSILAPYVTGYLADQMGSMKVGFYLAAALLMVGMIAFSFSKEERTNAA
jgi:sugar phosphate permease